MGSLYEYTDTNFDSLIMATRKIVDYLFYNVPDFWKLLYYKDKDALSYDEVSSTIKQSMICKDPSVDDTSDFSVLFNLNLDDSISIAIPQVRIALGSISQLDVQKGHVEIIFQIIVPNKQSIIVTDDSDVSDRAVSLFHIIYNAFNRNTELKCFSTSMFFNRNAELGAGRTNNALRQNQNTNYSGYVMTMSAFC